jgi:hypothetical protein
MEKRKKSKDMSSMKVAIEKILKDRFIKYKEEDILIGYLRWCNKKLFNIQQITIIIFTVVGFILTFFNNLILNVIGYTLMFYGIIFSGIIILFYFPIVIKKLKLIKEAFDFSDGE